MILRLSTKLAAKLKVAPSQVLPLDDHPFADWSANLLTIGRIQYVIFTNTASLYSVVFPGRGIAGAESYIESAWESLQLFLTGDGLEVIFPRFVAPASSEFLFSKALNHSVTGSMNDLVIRAKFWLTERGLAPNEVALRLNDVPFSSLKFHRPRREFLALVTE